MSSFYVLITAVVLFVGRISTEFGQNTDNKVNNVSLSLSISLFEDAIQLQCQTMTLWCTYTPSI
jgi:hypothetical protein